MSAPSSRLTASATSDATSCSFAASRRRPTPEHSSPPFSNSRTTAGPLPSERRRATIRNPPSTSMSPNTGTRNPPGSTFFGGGMAKRRCALVARASSRRWWSYTLSSCCPSAGRYPKGRRLRRDMGRSKRNRAITAKRLRRDRRLAARRPRQFLGSLNASHARTHSFEIAIDILGRFSRIPNSPSASARLPCVTSQCCRAFSGVHTLNAWRNAPMASSSRSVSPFSIASSNSAIPRLFCVTAHACGDAWRFCFHSASRHPAAFCSAFLRLSPTVSF